MDRETLRSESRRHRNRGHRRGLALTLCVVLALKIAAASPTIARAAAGDERWSPSFDQPGVNSWVNTLVEFNGSLYVGGSFTQAGSVEAQYVAQWRDGAWSPLASGVNLFVRAMAVYDGELIVAGEFTQAGGVAANHIAAWDGNAWRPLGSGTDGTVTSLVVHDRSLYVGGEFTHAGGIVVNRIARWDGEAWHALGPGTNRAVNALTVYREELVAGGDFSQAGDLLADRVARWDGREWRLLGSGITHSGVNGGVDALTIYNSDLVAGGSFTRAGGLPASRVARWNGSSWAALGRGVGPEGFSSVECLAVYNGLLIAGGRFYDGDAVCQLEAWTGGSWVSLGFPCTAGDATVLAFAVFDGSLYVAGDFTFLDLTAVNNIARWDGTNWLPLGYGMDGPINAMAVYAGELVVGGTFTRSGGLFANHVARWNGSRWVLIQDVPTNTGITALSVYNGQLVAAVNGLLWTLQWWDGVEWRALSPDMAGRVHAMTVFQGSLVVGGSIGRAGDFQVNNVACWNGSAWAALSPETSQTGVNGTVRALAVYNGDLVAAGEFTQAGTIPANRIARWNGTAWQPLGEGLNGDVYALAVSGGVLIAGGLFTEAGGVPAKYVAGWDGVGWSPLGPGFDGPVYTLHVSQGVIAGGGFRHAGTAPADYLDWWNGEGWSPFGSGLDGPVRAMASYDGLFVGGSFTTAGVHPSSSIARWEGGLVPVELLSFTAERQGVVAILRWEVANDREPVGFHVYRQERGLDRRLVSERPVMGTTGRFVFVDPNPPAGATDYWLAELSRDGSINWHGPRSLIDGPPLPVLSSSPNPARGPVEIAYRIDRAGPVSLRVFDVAGRSVKSLVEGALDAGPHVVIWDGSDGRGSLAASSVYFLRLEAGGRTSVAQLVMIR